MTPEQHNKYLAWSHIAYGGLFMFLMMMMMVFVWVMMSIPPNPPPFPVILMMSLFMMTIWGAMIVPSFIAGYGLLKRKKWARVWAIISAVVAASNVPFGTAVTVYTFWFLFSDPGKRLFEQNSYALPPGRQTWANQQWDYEAQRQRESQYNPPPPPPDWR